MRARIRATRGIQRGITVVEFGIIALFFLTLLLGIMELGRVMYVWNTAQEITRHAAREATVTDFTNATAMAAVRQQAVFRSSAGPLPAGGEITDSSVDINYLNSSLGYVNPGGTCPSKNVYDCLSDPNGNACIRFVQVRLCAPGSGNMSAACTPVQYSPLVPLFSFLAIDIPVSTVVMPAESLGFRPSSPAC